MVEGVSAQGHRGPNLLRQEVEEEWRVGLEAILGLVVVVLEIDFEFAVEEDMPTGVARVGEEHLECVLFQIFPLAQPLTR